MKRLAPLLGKQSCALIRHVHANPIGGHREMAGKFVVPLEIIKTSDEIDAGTRRRCGFPGATK